LASVNGRASICRKTARSMHNSYREGTNRKSSLYHHNILKKKAMGHFSETLSTTTAAGAVNRSCRCSEFLRGQTPQLNVMNIMFCSFFSGLFCSPEQYCRAIPISSEPLPSSDLGCLSHETIHTLDHC